MRFLIDGDRIHPDETPDDLALEDGDSIVVLFEQTGFLCFDKYPNSIGINYLTQKNKTISSKSVDHIIQHLNADPNATYVNQEDEILIQTQRTELIQFLDQQWNGKDQDFKLQISNKELVQLIGHISYNNLTKIFDGKHDKILLRRCMKHGNVIKFHIDNNYKTLQVPLNSESSYQGGRLVYVTKHEGMVFAKRNAGSLTIHNNNIAHGVTCLESGVRYGLFLLQKE